MAGLIGSVCRSTPWLGGSIFVDFNRIVCLPGGVILMARKGGRVVHWECNGISCRILYYVPGHVSAVFSGCFASFEKQPPDWSIVFRWNNLLCPAQVTNELGLVNGPLAYYAIMLWSITRKGLHTAPAVILCFIGQVAKLPTRSLKFNVFSRRTGSWRIVTASKKKWQRPWRNTSIF